MEGRRDVGLRVEKFNGRDNEDFGIWAVRVMAVLEGEGLADVVIGEETPPEDVTSAVYSAYLKKARKARAILVMGLGNKPLRVVQNSADPYTMWSKLHERYAATTTANKISVLTNLMNMRYIPGKDMGEYLCEFETLFNRLECMGSPQSDDMQVAILLVSIMHEDTLSGTIAAIKTMDESKATWDYVSSRLLEEQRSIKLADNAERAAAAVRAATAKRRDLSKVKCFKCQKMGHIAKTCKNKRVNPRNNKDDEDKDTTRVRAAMARTSNDHASFIVDSGASSHIANSLDLFTSLKDISPVKVHLADDTVVEACQEGTIYIDMDLCDGKPSTKTTLQLKKVLYIPEAGVSMVSCAQLDKSGISTTISNGRCIFTDRYENENAIGYATRRRVDGLFILNGMVIPKETSVAFVGRTKVKETEQGVDLWHQRLGHISKDRVRNMTGEFVTGMSLSDEAERIDCTTCVESKQHKASATGTLVKENGRDAIHSDIIGPIRPRSLGGGRYLLCFIVGQSRFGKVFVIKKRSEATERFKEFKAWVERQTQMLIKQFHSDGAKEYLKMGDFLVAAGIDQTQSTAYTPQSNGIAERYNRTLLDKTRAMLIQSGLPMSFWGEAALHAAYLSNITGSSVLKDKTPHELLFNHKPDLSKLRVFGCAAYVHQTKERRKLKLSKRSTPGILVSHQDGMYHVWLPETRKVVASKHVKFDEMLFPATDKGASELLGQSVEFDEPLAPNEEYIDISLPILMNDVSEEESIVEPETQGAEVNNGDIIQDQEGVVENGPRYPQRNRSAPEFYRANAARQENDDDTPTLRSALEGDESDKWKLAIKDELTALQNMNTWKIINKPPKVKVIYCKWVLRKKRTADGLLAKYKARLVICGNRDTDTVHETYAPVVDFTIVRLILAIAVQRGWLIHQVDYSNAFLQGDLNRTVYMEIPKCFEGDTDGKVCSLMKSLYGLREAPRIWYKLLSKELCEIGLKPLPSAPCVFIGDDVIVLCYVDDLLLIASSEKKLAELKSKLSSRLPANDLGEATDFLGIKLVRKKDGITLVQSKYTESLIAEMGMGSCRDMTIPHDPSIDLSLSEGELMDDEFPYRRIVGIMMYISTHTRPDIAVVVSMLARHVNAPTKIHQNAALKLLKYMKATSKYGLKLQTGDSNQLSAHVDSNWAGESGSGRRSRTGIVIYYGNALVHYNSTLQKCIALSSTEAEFVALSESTKILLWLRRVLNELSIPQETTRISEDNSGAVKWVTGNVAQDFRRSKHIELRYHHICEHVQSKAVDVVKVSTKDMHADFLTKCLGRAQLIDACNNVGVVNNDTEKAC